MRNSVCREQNLTHPTAFGVIFFPFRISSSGIQIYRCRPSWNALGERIGIEWNCPRSSRSRSPVTKQSAPAAKAVPSTGKSSGSRQDLTGTCTGSTSSIRLRRNRTVRRISSAGAPNFVSACRANSSRMCSETTTVQTPELRQTSSNASQMPRVITPDSSTLVSKTTLTRQP